MKTAMILASAFLLGTSATAQEAGYFPHAEWDTRLDLMTSAVLSPVIRGLEVDIPSPPMPGTDAAEADYAAARERYRLPKAREISAFIARADVYDISESVIEDGLLPDREAAPALWSIVDEAYNDLSLLGLKLKKSTARLRPYQKDPSITPLADTPGTPSFPSQVAADLRLFTQVAAELTDLCHRENDIYSANIALGRIDAGMSTMIDLRGGLQMSDWYLTHLKSSELWAEFSGTASEELRSFYTDAGCVTLPE